MRWSITLAFAAAMFFGGHTTAQSDKASPSKKLYIELSVKEGDPLGSREAGTIKVLSQPQMITKENSTFTWDAGGELPTPDDSTAAHFNKMIEPFTFIGSSVITAPGSARLAKFGRMIQVKCGDVKDGKIDLDITVYNTTAADTTGDSIRLNTEITRTVTQVPFKEVVKYRFGKGTANKQAWVELCIIELNS